MVITGNPKVINVNIGNDFIMGIVTGTRNKWTFKSSSPLFLEHFPGGILSATDITNDSPRLHKDIAQDITKKGFFSKKGYFSRDF